MFLFLLFSSCYSLCDPVKHDSQYHDSNPPFESHANLHLGDTFQYYFPQAPADIIAATTTIERDIMMVWLTPARIVGNASGNCTL